MLTDEQIYEHIKHACSMALAVGADIHFTMGMRHTPKQSHCLTHKAHTQVVYSNDIPGSLLADKLLDYIDGYQRGLGSTDDKVGECHRESAHMQGFNLGRRYRDAVGKNRVTKYDIEICELWTKLHREDVVVDAEEMETKR